MKANCIFQIAFIELHVLKCLSLCRGKSLSQEKENLYDSLALREILVQGRISVCVCVCVVCVCVWCGVVCVFLCVWYVYVCVLCLCVCGVCGMCMCVLYVYVCVW
jgi:ABC-type polysaccharide/polyol phosphate export permease